MSDNKKNKDLHREKHKLNHNHLNDEGDDQTLISRPSAKAQAARKCHPRTDPALAEAETDAIASQNFRQLTQINQIFHSQQSDHGFSRAQGEVNEALARKKILLNKRFVLESVIGSGGMGTVFKARDLRKVEARDANPYVAVKVLNSDFKKHPDAFISLQREASRSHLLSHPHIVTVHDFDRDGNSIYMTMELLQGEALDVYLDKHAGKGIPFEDAIQKLTQLFDALEFAHGKGIIHSDLKPANIFVSDQGVKILDFGIARLAAESNLHDQFDAGTIGAITPAYASLEMLEKKKPDASDDVYAAAIVAYQLLAGVHPYQGKSAATAQALKLQPKKIEGLSSRQWKALSRALSFRREKRTASIKEFRLGLTQAFQFPIFKVASVVLLLMVAWFSYTKFLVPDELTQFVDESMGKANQCYQRQEYFCAISSVNAVLKIAPDHSEANSILKLSNQGLQEQQKQQKIEKTFEVAKSCLESQDFQCAVERAQAVLSLSPGNASALEIVAKGNSAIEAKERLQAEQQQQFADSIGSANKCFNQKNYKCAIEKAKLAQSINQESSEAESIIRNASYAQRQENENLNKANKIFKDAQACFKKLNYSCAIAKSESALEFVPSHKRALALKKEAEKTIANVKKTIEIE